MKRVFLAILCSYSVGLFASNDRNEPARLPVDPDCGRGLSQLSEQSPDLSRPFYDHPPYTGRETHKALQESADKFGLWEEHYFSGMMPMLGKYVELTPEERAMFDKELGKRLKKKGLKTDGDYVSASVAGYLNAQEAVANNLWFEAKRLEREHGRNADPAKAAEAERLRGRAREIYRDTLAKYIEFFRGKPTYHGRISENDRAQLGANVASVMEKFLEAAGVQYTKTRGRVPMASSGEYAIWEIDVAGDCTLCKQAKKFQKERGEDFKLQISPLIFWRDIDDGFIDLSPPRYFLSPTEVLNLEIPPHSVATINKHFTNDAQVSKLATPMDLSIERYSTDASGRRRFDSTAGAEIMTRLLRLQQMAADLPDDKLVQTEFITLVLNTAKISDSLDIWHRDTALASSLLTHAMVLLPHSDPQRTFPSGKVPFQINMLLGDNEPISIIGLETQGKPLIVMQSQYGTFSFPANGGLKKHFDTVLAQHDALVASGYAPEQVRRMMELTWEMMAALKIKTEVGNRFAAEMKTNLPDVRPFTDGNVRDMARNRAARDAMASMPLPNLTRTTLRTAPVQQSNSVAAVVFEHQPKVPTKRPAQRTQVPTSTPQPFLHQLEALQRAKDRASKDKAAEQIAMTSVQRYAEDRGWVWQDVSKDAVGYDVELYNPFNGETYKVEIKSKTGKSDALTMYRSEVENFVGKPESMLLAVVKVSDDGTTQIELRQPRLTSVPDTHETARTYRLSSLLGDTPALRLPQLMRTRADNIP